MADLKERNKRETVKNREKLFLGRRKKFWTRVDFFVAIRFRRRNFGPGRDYLGLSRKLHLVIAVFWRHCIYKPTEVFVVVSLYLKPRVGILVPKTVIFVVSVSGSFFMLLFYPSPNSDEHSRHKFAKLI